MTKVYSNHHLRSFLTDVDVPQETLDWYDHLSEEDKSYGWIHYRNHWYHVSDFMRILPSKPDWMHKWHGYNPDSFFSGVVIKFIDDIDGDYIIGTYKG
jgi:hypothetical protein